MERGELEREMEGLHAESWGWALACCARRAGVAEDVLQSAYLRVLSGRARFNGGSTVRTWLFGVIRLVALEETRRGARWRARTASVLEASEIADPASSADLAVLGAEKDAVLKQALATLSPRQREVLQLVFYHDMTIEEAASVMHVSIGSARTHYTRGKEALGRRLAGEDRP